MQNKIVGMLSFILVLASSCSSNSLIGTNKKGISESSKKSNGEQPSSRATAAYEEYLNTSSFETLERVRDWFAVHSGDSEFSFKNYAFANLQSWTEQTMVDLVDNRLYLLTNREMMEELNLEGSRSVSADDVLELASELSLNFLSDSKSNVDPQSNDEFELADAPALSSLSVDQLRSMYDATYEAWDSLSHGEDGTAEKKAAAAVHAAGVAAAIELDRRNEARSAPKIDRNTCPGLEDALPLVAVEKFNSYRLLACPAESMAQGKKMCESTNNRPAICRSEKWW